MRLNIVSKNMNPSENLKASIEKKFSKLNKYFSDDIEAKIMLSREKERQKIEATINAKGIIFRAEEETGDIYEGVDKVTDKLASQMSRFKDKIKSRHKGCKGLIFDELPDYDQEEEIHLVKRKHFDLVPMDVEEAIVQMELLQHNFFVFLNIETDSVNVVYRRNDNDYGLLETTY